MCEIWCGVDVGGVIVGGVGVVGVVVDDGCGGVVWIG